MKIKKILSSVLTANLLCSVCISASVGAYVKNKPLPANLPLRSDASPNIGPLTPAKKSNKFKYIASAGGTIGTLGSATLLAFFIKNKFMSDPSKETKPSTSTPTPTPTPVSSSQPTTSSAGGTPGAALAKSEPDHATSDSAKPQETGGSEKPDEKPIETSEVAAKPKSASTNPPSENTREASEPGSQTGPGAGPGTATATGAGTGTQTGTTPATATGAGTGTQTGTTPATATGAGTGTGTGTSAGTETGTGTPKTETGSSGTGGKSDGSQEPDDQSGESIRVQLTLEKALISAINEKFPNPPTPSTMAIKASENTIFDRDWFAKKFLAQEWPQPKIDFVLDLLKTTPAGDIEVGWHAGVRGGVMPDSGPISVKLIIESNNVPPDELIIKLAIYAKQKKI
ncbi:MAG: hypothetical protein NkDv07_0675 [Candidatus Improbicoccus devescovinae]|nr:MAG: hypothetical protein NkDv07_0675 [Candidatus Improbicoccus devescovinae]